MAGTKGFADKTDGIPTYPLQNLREMDDSKTALDEIDDNVDEKRSKNTSNHSMNRDFGNLSVDREPRAYKGVYIQSQIR